MGLSQIIEEIRKAQTVLLIAHIQPDGDTLGSCFGFGGMLEKLGKRVFICCDADIPQRYAELFPALTPLTDVEAPDVAVALDCADRARLGKCEKLFAGAPLTINIDHHVTNEGFADINYIAEASSVGEIIFELMQEMDIAPDAHIAQSLYIAIATDTGNFTYANTSGKSMAYAAGLIELFDLRSTADALFRRRSLVTTQLIGRALSRLETYRDGKIASVTLLKSDMKEFGARSEDCDSIVDFAREIEQTEVAVFFRELLPGGVKVSFRSKGGVDVGAVAAQFGGGGHAGASGCCTGGQLEDVKRAVLDRLKELV